MAITAQHRLMIHRRDQAVSASIPSTQLGIPNLKPHHFMYLHIVSIVILIGVLLIGMGAFSGVFSDSKSEGKLGISSSLKQKTSTQSTIDTQLQSGKTDSTTPPSIFTQTLPVSQNNAPIQPSTDIPPGFD